MLLLILLRILCRQWLPMDITKHWISSFVMLRQAFTGAVLSCCLFVGLFLNFFKFCLKHVKYMLGLRSGDWLGYCRIFQYSCFPSTFWIIVHLCREAPSNLLRCTSLSLSRNWIPLYFRIHLATTVFCHVIYKHKWPGAIGSHACPCHHMASIMFYRRCGVPGIMSC